MNIGIDDFWGLFVFVFGVNESFLFCFKMLIFAYEGLNVSVLRVGAALEVSLRNISFAFDLKMC